MTERADRNLGLDLVRVTEAAALAAGRWMGRSQKEAGDEAAVRAMRLILGTVDMDGVVVIGEGEKDAAPMLFNEAQPDRVLRGRERTLTRPAGSSPDRSAIVPSMLDVDFARLAEEVADLERAGADRLQWDVMDGRFVPRLTHGPDTLRSVRDVTALPFEAHLMIDRPEHLWSSFVEAGADIVIVHAETTTHLHLLLGDIRRSGARAGVAINPATPVSAIAHVVDLLDLVLVMTVNPGHGGQAFIRSMLAKVVEARALLDAVESPADLEVDGGVSAATVGELVRRGASVLVAGSAVHRHPEGRAAAIRELREAAVRG